MIKVRVSSKGQVVIPIEVRTRYEINTGTELELREGSGYISLHPLPENPVAAARGILRTGQQQSLTEALLQGKRPPAGRAAARGGRQARQRVEQEPADVPAPRTLFDPPAG